MSRIVYLLLLLLGGQISAQIRGQEPSEPVGEDAVTPAVLAQQLRSEQPAEIAWAAYRVGQHGYKALAQNVREALASLAAKDELSSQEARHLGLSLFDALVAIEAEVPAKELAPWLDKFAAQCLALAARDPKAHVGTLLRFVSLRSCI